MTWTKELDEAAVLATKTGHWHVVLFYLLCGLAAIPTSFLVFSQVRSLRRALDPDLNTINWCKYIMSVKDQVVISSVLYGPSVRRYS